MLRQDQSVYCEHNSANTFNTLNDVAFKDTHATVNVPGDAWQLPSPKPAAGGLLTMEDTVQDMMETLQQIIGDNNFTESLDVEPDELKCWESMLLKMSNTNCDMGEELNDILNNDILTYVEEQLQKDGGLKLPDQLDVPVFLSNLDPQNQNPDQDGKQNFGWPAKPQNQQIPNKGQITAGRITPSLGIMKLTHMDLPNDSGLRGPTHQQIVSHQPPVDLGNIGAPVTFNPSLVDPCTQAQYQLRVLQVNANEHNLGAFRQTNQLHSTQMAQIQNPLHTRTSNHSVDLHDQSAEKKLHPMFNIQGNQLNSSVKADNFVETYNQNISTQPSFTAEPPLSSFGGHFAVQTQNNGNQRQSWTLQQQQLISSGPQQMGACPNPMSGFQRNSVLGVVAPQNPIKIGPVFSTPEMSNASFTAQEALEPPPLGPSGSCMFSNISLPVPVNGVHLSQAAPCQRMNFAGNQIASKSSCFYEGLPGRGSVEGVVAIQNPDEAVLSCQMTTGLDTNGLMVQQQFLNFNDQTQVKHILYL